VTSIGFNVEDNSFKDVLDQYSGDLENDKVRVFANEKISEIFNDNLKKYVLKISVSEKACKGNVGDYLIMQSSGPFELKVENQTISIPFDVKLKEPYKQLFEHDFSMQKGILIQGISSVKENGSFDLDWEKLIDNESELEKGVFRFTIDRVNSFGDTKDLVESYIEIIRGLNNVSDINIQIDRGKNGSSSNSSSMDNESSNENAGEEQSNTTEASVSKADCNEFLNDYDNFATSYVAFAKKYKKNPNDASLLSDAVAMNADMAQWASKSKDFDGCDDPSFITKLASIQLKLAEAAAVLSF